MYEVTEPNSYRDPKRPKLIDLGGLEVQRGQRPSPKGPSTPLPPPISLPPIAPTLYNCPATASSTLIERREYHDEGDGDSLYVTLLFALCAPYSSKYAVIVSCNRRKASRLSYNLQPDHRHCHHYRPLTLLYPSWDSPSLLLSVSRGNSWTMTTTHRTARLIP